MPGVSGHVPVGGRDVGVASQRPGSARIGPVLGDRYRSGGEAGRDVTTRCVWVGHWRLGQPEVVLLGAARPVLGIPTTPPT